MLGEVVVEGDEVVGGGGQQGVRGQARDGDEEGEDPWSRGVSEFATARSMVVEEGSGKGGNRKSENG